MWVNNAEFMIQSKLEQLSRILERKKKVTFLSLCKFLKIHKAENTNIPALIYFKGLL